MDGAEWGRPVLGQVTQRYGFWCRALDSRIGTIDVIVPSLRAGTYFPDWFFEHPKRTEFALVTVVADCCFAGVSPAG